MSYADELYKKTCLDILENGFSDDTVNIFKFESYGFSGKKNLFFRNQSLLYHALLIIRIHRVSAGVFSTKTNIT